MVRVVVEKSEGRSRSAFGRQQLGQLMAVLNG